MCEIVCTLLRSLSRFSNYAARGTAEIRGLFTGWGTKRLIQRVYTDFGSQSAAIQKKEIAVRF